MKDFLLTIMLAGVALAACSQQEKRPANDLEPYKKEISAGALKSMLVASNFSKLFLCTDNTSVYGFIGDNYQRIRIKIIKLKKDSSSVGTYLVYGKSMVRNNICEFSGTLVISKIFRLFNFDYGVDDEYKNKGIKGRFEINGAYLFAENRLQKNAGVFKGHFYTWFYINRSDRVRYDDIDMQSDGYSNNRFTGTWQPYNTNLTKRCNWGDFRIPDDGDLDMGAGYFSPADKYLKYGWQSVRDAPVNNGTPEALKIEGVKWWE